MDYAGFEKHYRRALEIAPNQPEIRQFHASFGPPWGASIDPPLEPSALGGRLPEARCLIGELIADDVAATPLL